MNNTIHNPKELKVKEVPLVDKVTAVYANLFKVEHTQEEFHFTFIVVSGEVAEVTAKVIVTPGHMQRLIEAMRENIGMYEKNFGKIISTPREHRLTAVEEADLKPLNSMNNDEGKEK